MSLTPEAEHGNDPQDDSPAAVPPPSLTPTRLAPVDLWAELDRLGRADRAILAQRWDDVRRSRRARRRAG